MKAEIQLFAVWLLGIALLIIPSIMHDGKKRVCAEYASTCHVNTAPLMPRPAYKCNVTICSWEKHTMRPWWRPDPIPEVARIQTILHRSKMTATA